MIHSPKADRIGVDDGEARWGGVFITCSALAIVLVVAACGGAPIIQDTFVGCYGLEENGDAGFRVRKDDNGYWLAVRADDVWEDETSMSPASHEGFADAWGDDAEMIEEALVASGDRFALVRLRKDAVVDGEPAPSRYVLLGFLIGGPLFEAECPTNSS